MNVAMEQLDGEQSISGSLAMEDAKEKLECEQYLGSKSMGVGLHGKCPSKARSEAKSVGVTRNEQCLGKARC